MDRINLCLAHMSGNEMQYIQEAFDTNWVVPLGPNVNAFEEDLEDFVNENGVLDKKVLQYAEDMFANIDYILAYLDSGETEMKPAAMRNINNFLNVYHHKLSMAFIPFGKWLSFRRKMKRLPPYSPVIQGDSVSVRRLAVCKKWAGDNYLFYMLFTFIRKVIFYQFLRPLWYK